MTRIVNIALLAIFMVLAGCDQPNEVTIDVSDVITLDQTNFHDQIKNYPTIMVMFYANWCPHSQKLEPEFEIAASILKDESVELAKVDASKPENEHLAIEFDIKSYPTLILFQNGDKTPYKSGRTSHDIVDFVRKQLGPAIKTIESYDDYELLIKRSSITVVGMFTAGCALESRAFNVVAEVLRDEFTFATVEDDHVKVQISEDDDIYHEDIIMVRHFEPKVIRFDMKLLTTPLPNEGTASGDEMDPDERDFSELSFNAREAQNLANWIRTNSFPTVAEIDQSNYERYVERGIPMIWLALDTGNTNKHLYTSILEEVALKYINTFSFLIVDNTKYNVHLEALGLTQFPAVSIQDSSERYVLDEDLPITVEVIDEFLAKYQSGELQPAWKSQPIPALVFDEHGIESLVGKSFKSRVIDSGRDYLIQFYTPWCPQCQELEAIWQTLAGIMTSEKENVRIARFDISENDIPVKEFPRVQGYPTILFVSGSDALNPVEFIDRERTVSELSNFLRTHAKDRYKVPMTTEELLETVNEISSFMPAAEDLAKTDAKVAAKVESVRGGLLKLLEQLESIQ